MRNPLCSRIPIRRDFLKLALRASALVAAALLCASGPLRAQVISPLGPLLRVAASEQPITIGSLDVRVLIHGLHAETTQTVVFNNPNGRVLEGELEFPLPDGATVAGFALDVDGQLIDGVVVAKDKARIVLEAEIRKGVDPGLVEQVRGNLYRARVYPIPAHGSRTVRLKWISELESRREEAAYHLPLPYDAPIAQVAMRVEVVRVPVQPEVDGGFGNLKMRQWENRWLAEAKWAGMAPVRDLLVRLPRLPAQLVDLEPGLGAESFFSVSDLLPAEPLPRDAALAKRAAPARIALAWDASGSRTAEATERELGFLQKLLIAWPNTAVDLVVFRDHPERPVSFEAGDAGRKLIEALRKEPNDGGTALARLNLTRAVLPHHDDAFWIVASDGLATLGEALPPHGDVPIWSVTGSSIADRNLLRELSNNGGGELLDLVALDAAAATRALAFPRPRLLRAIATPSSAVADLMISQRSDRERVTISGRMLTADAELTLEFGGNESESATRVIKLARSAAAPAGDGPGPVAIAWAQGRAESLAVFAERNAPELLALGQRFGLVTAGTSLLVLDTLEQHLQHSVEPAASRPAMRQQYFAQIGDREKEKQRLVKDHLDEVAQLWQARVDWWNTAHNVEPGWRWKEEREERGDWAPRVLNDAAADGSVALGSISAGAGAGARAVSRPPSPAPAAAASMRMQERFDVVSESAPAASRAMAKKFMSEAAPSTEASIAIAPWDPKVPYLAMLRQASPGAAYVAYLAQKSRYGGPAFFLDCAEFLIRAGEKEKGLRVLSNLAELRLDDPALLRVLAWRMAQGGDYDAAAGILEKVLRLRPEEPHSRRDLALVLADRAEANNQPADAERAIALLYEVVQQRWERFPEIELVALMELNRILARAERRNWSEQMHAERLDSRLIKLLDMDLRVSLSWDADLTDVDLHVFEPTGEHAFYSHNRTEIGGLVSRDMTQGYGPEEYLVRRAVPGNYAVKVHYYGSGAQTLVGPATMTATVFTNWGRADEKRQVLTLRLDRPKDMEAVGIVKIAGAAITRGAALESAHSSKQR